MVTGTCSPEEMQGIQPCHFDTIAEFGVVFV